VIVVDKAASTIATAVLVLMARQTPGWTPPWQADAPSALRRPGESRLSAAFRARRRRVGGRVDPRREGSDRPNALGGIAWACTIGSLAYVLGSSASGSLGAIGFIGVAIAVLVYLITFIRRRWRRRRLQERESR
jgi:hypothetical protein